ncbi:hypothetical protein BA193_11070 [Yersinia pseudotuberculosis]|nr:hypothetical protein BLA52_12310 [Yersinia pseudotuberculosis]PSH24957.1 hypothetical protein BLA50_14640 [Yersinia pseudotuberculosis]PSH28070.1 hypothetical protein BLA51_18255 [Yersinia pseudotuberculosis]PSH35839.1 hypothetical protein BA197_10035 [Yersinia pseudotuberculosis]PSH44423.1 hypothetical protein BA193_11070 [Yersinia pseudotuberculosis]
MTWVIKTITWVMKTFITEIKAITMKSIILLRGIMDDDRT